MDESQPEFRKADILLSGQKIAAVGPDLVAPPESNVLQADGLLAIPGLINAHFHSPGNLLRGQLDCLPLEIFMLREVPPLAGAAGLARLGRIRTLLGAAEMLRGGITAVMDDAYHVPIATADGIDAICNAYAEIGLRARVAIDQPNVVEYAKYPYLPEILPERLKRRMESMPLQSDAELEELNAYLVERWHGAAAGLIEAAVSCSAPHRVTSRYLQTLNRLSLEHELPFNMHILETRLQHVFGQKVLGKSLVRHAAEQRILHRHSVVIHAIWVDDDDIATLAEHDVMVAHNPVCNLRLGSGIAPFRKWREAGIRVCIGTDEIAADDRASLWDAMKTAGMIHTLADPDWQSWPSAREILKVAVSGGAEALGRADRIGKIAVGFQADIALLDLDTYAFTPLNDIHRQLVYCESGSSVKHVSVAGRQVVMDGKVTTIDERALRAEARDIARSGLEQADESVSTLEGYYRKMVLEAHRAPANFSRRLDG